MRIIWFICGAISLTTGIIGIFVPLLPTVVFLLIAAFCFGKSSERAHNWLINHPKLGPPIREWNEKGAINRRAKILASISMAIVLLLSLLFGLGLKIVLIQLVTLGAVSIFIWTRPEE